MKTEDHTCPECGGMRLTRHAVLGRSLPKRGDVGLAEATRDPIFLLQSRQLRWSDADLPIGFEWDEDREVVIDSDGETADENHYMLTSAGCVTLFWETERVFFTREEAEKWGQAHAYRWDAWRVWCLPAQGELAALLRAVSERPTGDLAPSSEAE